MAKCTKTRVTLGYKVEGGRHVLTWAENGKRLPYKEAKLENKDVARTQLGAAASHYLLGPARSCFDVRLTAPAKNLIKGEKWLQVRLAKSKKGEL